MDYTDKEIELFLESQLKEHGEWLTKRFREKLEKNKNRSSGRLIGSMQGRNFSVRPNDGGATLAIDILEYGRLMEIGGRKRKLATRNRRVWEKKNHTPRGRKQTQWYNKNMYGGLGWLIRTITAGIGEEELQRIRDIISSNVNSASI